MTPDLLAAAERLRRIKRGESCEEVYKSFASVAGQHLLDYTTVGDALTDETPIDEAWLRSMEWEVTHPFDSHDHWLAKQGQWELGADGLLSARGQGFRVESRGKLTALLFALGATK